MGYIGHVILFVWWLAMGIYLTCPIWRGGGGYGGGHGGHGGADGHGGH